MLFHSTSQPQHEALNHRFHCTSVTEIKRHCLQHSDCLKWRCKAVASHPSSSFELNLAAAFSDIVLSSHTAAKSVAIALQPNLVERVSPVAGHSVAGVAQQSPQTLSMHVELHIILADRLQPAYRIACAGKVQVQFERQALHTLPDDSQAHALPSACCLYRQCLFMHARSLLWTSQKCTFGRQASHASPDTPRTQGSSFGAWHTCCGWATALC